MLTLLHLTQLFPLSCLSYLVQLPVGQMGIHFRTLHQVFDDPNVEHGFLCYHLVPKHDLYYQSIRFLDRLDFSPSDLHLWEIRSLDVWEDFFSYLLDHPLHQPEEDPRCLVHFPVK
jgi:hypothetical protein